MPSLAEVLLEKGIFTRDELYAVLKKYRGKGKSFEEIIVETGLMDEEKLIELISSISPYRPIDLRHVDIDRALLQLIPVNVAEKYLLIPIARSGNYISVAMANPLDAEGISWVTKLTKLKPIPFIAPLGQLRRAIRKHYYGEETVSMEESGGLDSLIVHEGNKFAISIAKEIISGRRHGVVVFYGPKGVGKTTLLKAMKHEIDEAGLLRSKLFNPASFLSDFRDAQVEGSLGYFTDELASLDVFMFDDPENLDRRSEECKALAYISEENADRGGCVVFTFLRAVDETNFSLDSKLKALVEGALLVPITPPSERTKMKILRDMAHSEGIDISDDVLKFIAERSGSSMRKLKGAIVQLKALEKYSGKRIPDNVAKSILRRYLG